MDTKKLRQKILDLAIRGKLVPQDPNDEPASVLLERIRAEKEQLIKEGKIKRAKKSAASDTSHYENVPFEVPGNWCWVKVADISSVIVYGVSESAKSEGKFKLLRITDIQDNAVNWNTVPYTDYPESKSENYILQAGDILFARTGATVGKSYLVDDAVPENAIYASYLIKVRVSNMIIPQYVKYFFESGFYWEQIANNSVGVGQPNVNGSSLGNLWVPIPPIQEQRRIVDKLVSWCLMIDKLSVNQELITQQIEELRNHILNLAISGKLVAQEPSDEPAIELLKRINPMFSPTHNRHYENVQYPDSWEVVKMGEMVRIISGVAYSKSDVTISGIKVIRGGNIQAGKIIECDDDVYIDNRYADPTNNIYKGDIVLVASTGSQQLIGKTGFATRDYVQTQIGAFLRILRPKDIRCADFLNLFFQSDYYRQYIRSLAKGTNINNVKNSYIEDFVIGLPPLQEQNRIVTFTNEIFYMIDEILAGL